MPADLLATANAALELVKKLRDAQKAMTEAERKSALADLTVELSEMKMAAADLRSELAGAKEEIASLKAAAARKADATPVMDEGCYVFPNDVIHYCVKCYEGVGKRIPMALTQEPWTVFGKWTCPVCEKHAG